MKWAKIIPSRISNNIKGEGPNYTKVEEKSSITKTNLFVEKGVEEMAFQELLRLPLFPLFQQLKVHIYDLQEKTPMYQETTLPDMLLAQMYKCNTNNYLIIQPCTWSKAQ